MVVIYRFNEGHLLPIYLLRAIYSISRDRHSTPVPIFTANFIISSKGMVGFFKKFHDSEDPETLEDLSFNFKIATDVIMGC